MKRIYIVFIASSYKTGNAIRMLTGGTYNHVALALEDSLNVLYSYSRSNFFEPLNGGYQKETPSRYFANHKDAQIRVCEYMVEDDHYQRIQEALMDYGKNQRETCYNFADLLVYPFKIHIPLSRMHTCISFVTELLEIHRFMSIGQLENQCKQHTIYEGSMKECVNEIQSKVEVNFFVRDTKWNQCRNAWHKNAKLCWELAGFMYTLMLHVID